MVLNGADCKVMALEGQPADDAPISCREANEALIYAIVGLFCCGFVLAPLALHKANQAKKLIEANHHLQGSGKVTAAIAIAIIELILWGSTFILLAIDIIRLSRSES